MSFKKFILLYVFILFFSCQNSEGNIKSASSDNQKDKVIQKPFNLRDYNDIQLDSIYALSKDSLFNAIKDYSFEKDSMYSNFFSYAELQKSKHGFNDFTLINFDYPCYSTSCYTFIYTKDSIIKLDKYGHLDTNIIWEDANFDNKIDLIIKHQNIGASRINADFYIFTKSDFSKMDTITSTDILFFNKKNKTLITYQDDGNWGGEKHINKWNKGGKLERIAYLVWEASIAEPDLLFTEYKIRNKKAIKLKSWRMSQEQGFAYFKKYGE